MSDQLTTEKPPRQRKSGMVIWITALGWLALSGIALLVAGDTLPFDRPALTGASTLTQIINGWLNGFEGPEDADDFAGVVKS